MSVTTDIISAAETVSGIIPGPAGVIARIALKAAAAFAAAGKDPVVEIERILGADPELKKVEAVWGASLAAKFGPKT